MNKLLKYMIEKNHLKNDEAWTTKKDITCDRSIQRVKVKG